MALYNLKSSFFLKNLNIPSVNLNILLYDQLSNFLTEALFLSFTQMLSYLWIFLCWTQKPFTLSGTESTCFFSLHALSSCKYCFVCCLVTISVGGSGGTRKFSCTRSVCILIILWYHTIFVFFGLPYFTWHNALQVHPCSQKWQDLLLFMTE